MDNIEIALRVALVLDAIALIALILVQQGKGANVGAAFGSGASQTMFGSGGASSFINTVITWLAVAFFVITFALAWAARERAEAMGTIGIPQIRDEVPMTDDDGLGGMVLPESDAGGARRTVPDATGGETGVDDVPSMDGSARDGVSN